MVLIWWSSEFTHSLAVSDYISVEWTDGSCLIALRRTCSQWMEGFIIFHGSAVQKVSPVGDWVSVENENNLHDKSAAQWGYFCCLGLIWHRSPPCVSANTKDTIFPSTIRLSFTLLHFLSCTNQQQSWFPLLFSRVSKTTTFLDTGLKQSRQQTA